MEIENGEIILLGNNGRPHAVSQEARTDLFNAMKDQIRVVVLNSCYSRTQAEGIIQVIDCAIGMSSTITDEAAIIFAASFYRALGFGRSVQEAFKQGKVALGLEEIHDRDIPQVFTRPGADPSSMTLKNI